MTVGQLIERLKEFDRDLKVFVYSEIDEGSDEAHGVKIQSPDMLDTEDWLYHKNYHPFHQQYYRRAEDLEAVFIY